MWSEIRFCSPLQDLIILRDGLEILLPRLVNVIDQLAKFAEWSKAFPTLGFTHLQ